VLPQDIVDVFKGLFEHACAHLSVQQRIDNRFSQRRGLIQVSREAQRPFIFPSKADRFWLRCGWMKGESWGHEQHLSNEWPASFFGGGLGHGCRKHGRAGGGCRRFRGGGPAAV